MGEPSWLEIPEGRRIAYHRTPGEGPGVVFLGGFASDMEGTKAVHLEAWAMGEKRGAYVAAVGEMVRRTSTDLARWNLVSSEDKRWARIRVLELVCEALEERLKG